MADITANRPVDKGGSINGVIVPIINFPMAASLHIFSGGMVGPDSSGNLRKASNAACLYVAGIARRETDNTNGAAGALNCEVLRGEYSVLTDGSVTSATLYGTDLYLVDDQTVSTSDSGGTRLRAGYFTAMDAFNSSNAVCCFGVASPTAKAAGATGGAGSTPFKVRAVITSIAAYAGSGTGVLTASATGAIGAQDGITLAAGDLVLLRAGLSNVSAAKDSGPYVVTNPGGTGIKFVLTRPSWWETAGAIVEGQAIDVGGEGTIWAGNAFKALCGKGKVVDTDDPTFYSRVYKKTVTLASGTYTLGAGGGLELFDLLSTTTSSVQATMNTPAGTLGTNKLGAPAASRVAGYAGTAAVVINSYVDAGTVSGETSTVDVLVTNW